MKSKSVQPSCWRQEEKGRMTQTRRKKPNPTTNRNMNLRTDDGRWEQKTNKRKRK